MGLRFEIVDVVFSLLILAASIRGARRGFVAEMGSMAALGLGVAGAALFSRRLSAFVSQTFGPSPWNQLICFLVIFLVVYILVKLIESALHSAFEKLNLERLDRALGFFLGLAEGGVLVAALLLILTWQPFFNVKPLLEGSFFARFLVPLLPAPGAVLPSRTL